MAEKGDITLKDFTPTADYANEMEMTTSLKGVIVFVVFRYRKHEEEKKRKRIIRSSKQTSKEHKK